MDVVVAVFTGEYDLSHKAILHVELSALWEQPNLVLDMSAVSFIDSTCIAELAVLQDRRREAGLGRLCRRWYRVMASEPAGSSAG